MSDPPTTLPEGVELFETVTTEESVNGNQRLYDKTTIAYPLEGTEELKFPVEAVEAEKEMDVNVNEEGLLINTTTPLPPIKFPIFEAVEAEEESDKDANGDFIETTTSSDLNKETFKPLFEPVVAEEIGQVSHLYLLLAARWLVYIITYQIISYTRIKIVKIHRIVSRGCSVSLFVNG